ncbi:HAD-IG family 5'-nucleotidase [Lujinxingia litoralis]|uniref:HAD-IG family 5'-nucleotidase n=1 Tax=Lujinxingia litoralis TaxID=2211119 RepID=UPI001314B6E8|nr:HAD-IG family 5'-nucleotidase [Lujinxingia litoralis]
MVNPPGTRQPLTLLESLRNGHAPSLEPVHQVFCNRDLNLAEVDAVGFDMDYTLAHYHQAAIERLSVEKTLERLVRERGYHPDILDLQVPTDFAIRGLVIDTVRGNIFKLDSHRFVGRVYHGFKELSGDDIVEYHTQAMSMTTSRYALVDTLFALPEAALYATLVDYFERTRPEHSHDWRRLYDDIRYCIDLAHRDNSIKDEIVAHLEHYLTRNLDLALTLQRLRSAGKKLFIVTNSYANFTQHIMSYLLDDLLPQLPRWQDYFDIVITGASKPGFFTDRAPFLRVDSEEQVYGEEFGSFDSDTIYQGGNLIDFHRMTGFRPDRVLYVGDHIYGDIVRSKKSTAWRTAMVVQEIEGELLRTDELREERARLDAVEMELVRINEEIAYELGLFRRLQELDAPEDDEEVLAAFDEVRRNQARLRAKRQQVLQDLWKLERQIETQFNRYWGLLFKMGNENTILGEQIEVYACIYTSRVENLVHYSPMHYFRAPRQPMPHERS